MNLNPKTKTILAALLVPCAALAGDWRDAYAKFSTKPNRTETLAVSWMVVPESKVQATCEAISKDSGLGGFGFAVDACSFWRKNTCLIVTGKQTTHAELGHELRHCYQGSFHP
jgi:hypothetical protein